jgi:hypothetical protein
MYIMLIGTHIKNVHVYYVDRNTHQKRTCILC